MVDIGCVSHLGIDRLQSLLANLADFAFGRVEQAALCVILKVRFVILDGNEGFLRRHALNAVLKL